MFRVEIPAMDLGHPVARQYSKWTQSKGLLFYGFIDEELAPATCSGIEGENMSAPDSALQNAKKQNTAGDQSDDRKQFYQSDFGSSPHRPNPISSQQSVSHARRLQPSSSAPGTLLDDEAALLGELFRARSKKKTLDVVFSASASPAFETSTRTTSLPAIPPAPHIRGRRELGKQAPVYAVNRAKTMPKLDVSSTASTGNPQDVLDAFSVRREALRREKPVVEAKPVGDLEFSPLPTSGLHVTYKTPLFLPTPPQELADSMSPTGSVQLESPPLLADDFQVSYGEPDVPLFLPDDEPPRARSNSTLKQLGAVPTKQPSGDLSSRPPPRIADPTQADFPGLSPAEDYGFEPMNAIIFEPGTYKIILLIDVREVKNKHDEDTLRKELSQKGVTIEVRNLNLGDMLWIARSESPGLRGEERECVLDYVVERKRLDDLCSSIRDGRYDEQKVSAKFHVFS